MWVTYMAMPCLFFFFSTQVLVLAEKELLHMVQSPQFLFLIFKKFCLLHVYIVWVCMCVQGHIHVHLHICLYVFISSTIGSTMDLWIKLLGMCDMSGQLGNPVSKRKQETTTIKSRNT